LTSDILLRLAGETTSKGSKKAGAKATYKVEIDELNNALVLAAPAAVIREVKNIVAKLDISRPQVLIEAVIAQLSEGQARELGSQLFHSSKDKGGYLTNFDGLLTTLLGTSIVGVPQDTTGVTAAAAQIPQGTVAFGGKFEPETGRGMGLLIAALKKNDDTNILSTPSVVTLDNEEAKLTSGEEVPFKTGGYSPSTNTGNTNPFNTYTREEVGILLTVKPQISKGNAVRLEIEQESSKVASIDPDSGVTTSKNTIKTNVMIENGELLVLGGLIEDTYNEGESKVPLLGDIPILGHLFKKSNKTQDKKVTMMFIRPTIIRTPEEARGLSNNKFKHLITRELDGKDQSKLNNRLEQILQEGQSTEAD
jgi:general secretion pathway protein D